MTEHQLRSYIRREILRESGGVYLNASDLQAIWSSVVDAFEMAKVAFKDVLSSAAYTFDVFTAENLEEIEEAKKNFQARKERIADEYANAFGKIQENMGPDFRAAVFLMAPNYYIGTKFALEGPVAYKGMVEYLKDAGIEVKDEPQRYSPADDDYDRMLSRAQEDSLMGRTTKLGSNVDFSRLSKEITRSLNRKTGVSEPSSPSTSESLRNDLPIIVEKVTSVNEEEKPQHSEFIQKAMKRVEDAIKDAGPDVFVKAGGAEKMLKEVEDEYKGYVSLLNAHLAGVAELSKAQNLEQAKQALSKMGKGAIKIEGMGPEDEKKVEAAAAEMVKVAKEEGKTEELLKSANMKPLKPAAGEKKPISEADVSPEDQHLMTAARKVAMQNAISKLVDTFTDPAKAGEDGKKYLAQLNSARQKFLQAFMSNVRKEDVEILKQSENGKKFLTVIQKGKSEISKAGLLGGSPVQ